jgi:glutathione S-transferase
MRIVHGEPTVKLFYAPGACSLGIHIILEELGSKYELSKVDFAAQQQYSPGFLAINPKSKVPTLVRDDGSVLTEFPAIALWLARTNPSPSLMPADAEAQARVIEAMDYIIATIHMQGFARLFRPGNFAPSEADHDKVKARGREIIQKGFALIDKNLQDKPYLAGSFSIADAALFYVEFWAKERMNIALPGHCLAHYERMKARSAVHRALATEGLAA